MEVIRWSANSLELRPLEYIHSNTGLHHLTYYPRVWESWVLQQ